LIVVEDGLSVGGELEITLSISLVAVCCSSAVRQITIARRCLVNNRHVLDGDDGLVAKILSSATCLPEKSRASARRTAMAPIATRL